MRGWKTNKIHYNEIPDQESRLLGMDFLMLLAQEGAENAATILDYWPQMAGILGGLGTAIGIGARALWSHMIKRENERIQTYVDVIAQKDSLIEAKDAKIEELSKSLSRKSDEMAAKIEELNGITLSKIEDYGNKFVEQQERMMECMSAFREGVREISKNSNG